MNNDTREQGAYDAPDQIQTISREIRKGNFKQMDETRIQSLTSQLESISGTEKYKEYQQAVMQTDGPNSVFMVSPTSRATGVSTKSRPTAIGDIVYMDGGTQAIVTGQNADGTFRARPTTSQENATIAGFANGVQSASYISGFVTSLAQVAAMGAEIMTTSNTTAYPTSPRKPTKTQTSVVSSQSKFNQVFADDLKGLTQAQKDAAWKVYQESSTATKPLVIGRLPDTERLENSGMQRLNTQDWTTTANDAWVQGGIDARKSFYLSSDVNISNLRYSDSASKFRTTIFYRELNQLKAAGYTRSGDYMIPPAK